MRHESELTPAKKLLDNYLAAYSVVWVRGRYKLSVDATEDLTTNSVRFVFSAENGEARRRVYVDFEWDRLYVGDHLNDAVLSSLSKLHAMMYPPTDGGAFTQDDALKLFGGGRNSWRLTPKGRAARAKIGWP